MSGRFQLEVLEPRVLLSAAGVDLVDPILIPSADDGHEIHGAEARADLEIGYEPGWRIDQIFDGVEETSLAQRRTGRARASDVEPLSALAFAALPAGVNLAGAAQWVEEGPAISRGGGVEGIPGSPVSGALGAIAIDPADATGNTMYVGSVNGGIWRTTNALWPADGIDNDGNGIADGTDANGDGMLTGAEVIDLNEAVHWEPLTDAQVSLSISDLAFDPTNSLILYAGLGRFSSFMDLGGTTAGLLKSTDGGTTWGIVGRGYWPGTEVATVTPTAHDSGEFIVVGTRSSDTANADPNLGLWWSEDGGDRWTQESGGITGLPAGAVTDVLIDPNDPTIFYAAVRQAGLYQGEYSAGANEFIAWTAVNTNLPPAAQIGRTELAAYDAGASTILYAAIVDQVTGAMIDVYRSSDDGATWNPLDPAGPPATAEAGTPGVHPSGQGDTHFSLAVHSTDPDIVFVGGDTQPLAGAGNLSDCDEFTARIFRGDFTPALGQPVWEPVVCGYANGTSPHADSREMLVTAAGLFELDDGGIYLLRNPDTRTLNAAVGGPVAGNRHWISLNGDLRVTEVTEVAWDAVANLIVAGSQDNGMLDQFDRIDNDGNGTTDDAAEAMFWLVVETADGVFAASETLSATQSWRYRMANGFDWFYRERFNAANGPALERVTVRLRASGNATDQSGLQGTDQHGTFPEVVLNEVEPKRMLIGRDGLYESTSQNRGLYIRDLTPRLDTPPAGVFSGLAYGGRNTPATTNRGVIYAAANNRVYVRPSATDAFRSAALPTGQIVELVMDPNNWQNAFALSNTQIFQTDDGGVNWHDITGTLGTGNMELRGMEYLPAGYHTGSAAPGVNVLLVGGLGGVYRTIHPNKTPATWTEFGRGLPNTIAHDLEYNRADDVLLAGTLGRGVYRLQNAAALLDDNDVLQVGGTDAVADVLGLIRNEANPLLLDVFFNNAGPAPDLQVPLASLRGIEFEGLAGDDILFVNVSHGVISVPDGIRFDGGAGSDTLMIEDATGGAGSLLTLTGGVWMSRNGQSMTIEQTAVEGFSETIAPDTMAQLYDGMLHSVAWSRDVLGDDSLGRTFPVLGPSFARALSGLPLEPAQRLADPMAAAVRPGGSMSQAPMSLLQRIFETGSGAFSLDEIGTTLTDPVLLRQALDDLDGTAGNVSLTQAGSLTRFDARIVRTLGGIADLEVEALGGAIELHGKQQILADVTVHLVFGVDANGFFIDPTFSADPEIVITNVRLPGSGAEKIEGGGRFGFIEVTVTDATLQLDPGVRFEVDLQTPGAGPVTGINDGTLRVEHLAQLDPGWAATTVESSSGVDDLEFTGTFEVAALLPGGSAPFTLGGAQVRLVWPEIDQLLNVEVSAVAGPGDDLVQFLETSAEELIQGLSDLATVLDSAAGIDLLSVEVPIINKSLGEILGGDPDPVIYDATSIGEISETTAAGGNQYFTVVLAAQSSLDAGIQPGDTVVYLGAAGTQLEGTVDSVTLGEFTVRVPGSTTEEPERTAPSVEVHRGGELGDSLRASLASVLHPASASFRIPTLQDVIREVARLLGIDPSTIPVQLVGSGPTQAIEIGLSLDPGPLEFSFSGEVGLGESVPGLELEASGSLTVTVDAAFQITVGLQLASGIAAAERFYVAENSAPEVSLTVSVALDDVIVEGQVGFLGVRLEEDSAITPNDGIVISGTLGINLTDPLMADDDRITAAEFASATLTSLFAASIDARFDIDGLKITATGPMATELGTLQISLEGEAPDPSPGHVENLEELRNVLSGLVVTGDSSFFDFSVTDPLEVLGMIKRLADWLEQFRGSSFFDVTIPFTSGTTLGDVFDFSKAFVDVVYSYLIEVELIAGGTQTEALRTSGTMSAAVFELQIDEETPVTISVSQASAAPAPNGSMADLAADFNAALAAAGLSARVQAKLNDDEKFVLASVPGSGVSALKITAAGSTDPVIAELGFVDEQTGVESPRFDDIQELADLLSEVLDPDGSGPLTFDVQLAYDDVEKEATLRVELAYSYSDSTSFEFESDLELGPLVEVSASGTIGFTIDLGVGFTLGIDLNAVEVPRLATLYVTPPPAHGQLQEDASFGVRLDGDALIELTLPRFDPGSGPYAGIYTANNTSLNDLAADFNSLFAATIVDGAPLSDKIVMQPVGSRLELAAQPSQLGQIHSIRLAADEDDPIVTEVGFSTDVIARSEIRGLFIEDAAATGTADISATGLAASARFAIFELSTAGGTADGSATVQVGLKNPDTSAPPSLQDRIYLDALFDNLSSIGGVLTPSASLEGSIEVALKNIDLDPDILTIPPGSLLRLFVPDLSDLTYNPDPYDGTNTGLFLEYPDLAGLGDFECFEFTDIVLALDALVDQLRDLSGFGFLNEDLPLLNASLGDLLDSAAELAELIEQLSTDPQATITELEADLEEFFGVDPSWITLSVEATADPVAVSGTATFVPSGQNNDIAFVSTDSGVDLSDVTIRFLDDGSLAAATDAADAAYDSTEKLLTIRYNSSFTTADTVRAEVNALHTAGTSPIQASLSTTDAGNDGSGYLTQTALKISLNYQVGYGDTLPLQFDLGRLVALLDPSSAAAAFLSGVTDFIEVSGSGSLNVTASAELRIDFGIDLSTACTWRPFLYDTTGLTLKAAVRGTDIDLQASVGMLGIFVQNGTATLDADGDPETTGDGSEASFEVGLIDNNGDGRHYFRASEAFFDDENLEIALTAGASAVLPLYFPTAGIPLGGTGDANGDGYSDNQLVVLIPDLKRIFAAVESELNGSFFEAVAAMPGAHNDLIVRTPSAGVEVVFVQDDSGVVSVTQVAADRLEIRVNSGVTTAQDVVNASFPSGFSALLSTASESGGTNTGAGPVYTAVTVIAPDISSLFGELNLCDLVTHAGVLLDGLDALLGTIQEGLESEVFSLSLPLVGDQFAKAASFIQDFREGLLADIRNKLAQAGDPIGLVKQAIFDVLGPGGLNLLVQVDASGALLTDGGGDPLPVTDPSQIQIDCAGDAITFKLRLAKNVALVDTSDDPIDLDIGVDGLGLEVSGNVQVKVGFDLKLYFGISASDGFYFDTSDGEELVISLEITIPGLEATGELLFLQLRVADESDGVDAKGNERAPSSFEGRFSVDLMDPIGSGDKLTFGDMFASGVSFEDIVGAELTAVADVNLDLEVSFDGDSRFPRLLAEFDLDWQFPDPDGENLEIGFNNIQLDVGSFLGQLVQPILEEIRKVTEPLDPIVDILTFRLPVISDLAGRDYTLLDLAEAFGFISPGTREFIDSVIEIVELINEVDISSGTVLVNIGSFNMRRSSTGELERDTSSPDPGPVDLEAETPDPAARNFLGRLEDLGFEFPFLDPAELFKLFRGEPVTLIEYHMPVLDFNFSYSQSFPIYPPLFAKITGSIGAKIELTFGYDTLGLQEFFSSSEKDPAVLLNGFFVKDVDDDGEDIPELTLTGSLTAGASIDLLVAEVGVQGGIFATVEFNLNDPDDDGKVRLNEIIANARQDIRCIFDIHGEIVAALEAFLIIDLFFFEIDETWRIAEVTLIEFDLTCPTPVLATDLGGGTLRLNLGPHAGDRVEIDTTDGAETFVVTHISGSAGNETVRVKWNGYSQDYAGVSRIVAEGGNSADKIDARGVLARVKFEGGDGNDTLYASDADAISDDGLYGGAGNDVLVGSDHIDHLYGGDGADTLTGHGGADVIAGDAGNDVATGDDDDDELNGGDGADELYGNEGADDLAGEGGNDQLFGNDGEDELDGGAGHDRLTGGRDEDWLIGGDGDDVLDGGGGDDVLLGDNGTIVDRLTLRGISGSGRDVLSGGPGGDVLFGAGGNDALFGGTLLENGETDVTDVDGIDFLDGGDGNDSVFADDAHADLTESFPAGTVGDLVWFDADADGVRDAGENGVAGIVVDLYDAGSSAWVASTTTGTDGSYVFTGLAAGSFFLEFNLPAGLTFTDKNQGSDEASDSDADLTTGQTDSFSLSGGQTDESWDAGLRATLPVITINDVAVTEGDSGIVSATFTVSLSNPSANLVTVCFETEPDTSVSSERRAAAGVDYESRDWTLIFDPGVTQLAVTIAVHGDLRHELNESFQVRLRDPSGATVGDAVGVATILDNDPVPEITVADGVVPIVTDDGVLDDNEIFAERNGQIRFTLRLSNPSYQSIAVDWRTADSTDSTGALRSDSARGGVVVVPGVTDYVVGSGTVVFLPGQTVKQGAIAVAVVNDLLNEANELFWVDAQLNVATASNAATFHDARGAGTIRGSYTNTSEVIVYDDAPPSVSISPVSRTVSEGHVGAKPVDFTVTLSGASGQEIRVNYATARGTATNIGTATESPDFDYVADTLVFAPGTVTATLRVEVLGDTEFEPDEYFFVNLLSATRATVAQNHAVVHLLNDDLPFGVDHGPWSVQFSAPRYEVDEGVGLAEITILRTEGSSHPVAVYWTLQGTATEGLDYDGIYEGGDPRRIVRFGLDETRMTFTIPIHDDALIEPDETLTLYLLNPTGGPVRAEIRVAELVILDDEPKPEITVDDVSVTEGNGANPTVTFTLSLSAASTETIQVNYVTANHSALSGSDYVFAVGTTTFNPGDLTKPVTVTVLASSGTPELTEDFYLDLSNALNAEIGDSRGVGTIIDDDPATLQGFVFQDLNGNGFFDEAVERGLAGVDVVVTDSGGSATTATTDVLGRFSASVLLGTTHLAVDQSTLPEGSILTTDNDPQTLTITSTVTTLDPVGYQPETVVEIPGPSIGNGAGYNDDTLFGGAGDDLMNGAGGDDELVGGHWLGPGCACDGDAYDADLTEDAEGHLRVDATALPAVGSLSGRVWIDANNDGTRGGAELLLASVQVNLYDENYNLISSTYTDAAGAYRFGDLAACDYFVQVLAPGEYAYTPSHVGSDSLDSDVNALTGLTAAITVGAGAAVVNVDAGLRALPAPSSGPWSLQFAQAVYSIRESDGSIAIGIERTPGSFEAVAVFFTKDGTALAGTDYVKSSGTFRLGLGELERSFVVAVFEDTTVEGFETVQLMLRNPTGGPVHGNRSLSILLIFDDPCRDDDVLFGDLGDDLILGDYGYSSGSAAVLLGGMGDDSLYGEDGSDTLYGEGGNDLIEGGKGDDTLDGGTQDDRYLFNGDQVEGTDSITELPEPFGGIDTLDFSGTAAEEVTLDLSSTLAQPVTDYVTLTLLTAGVIENAWGGSQNDTLSGNSGDNVLNGGAGDDTLVGAGGDDLLGGGSGDDTYLFGADAALGHDRIEEDAGAGRDRIDFSATVLQGVSMNLGSAAAQTVNGNLGLTLSSATAIEDIVGGAKSDSLLGNSLNNRIQGGLGNDTLDGADGRDELAEDRAGNFQVFNGSLTINGTETDTFANFEDVRLVGDDTANVLDASSFSGTVYLDGRGGDDTLIGGSGLNILTGGRGQDSFDFTLGTDFLVESADGDFVLTDSGLTIVLSTGAEMDSFTGNLEAARLSGEGSANVLDAASFSTGPVWLDGGDGDDTLIGTGSDDILAGGTGDDTLRGGAGDDVYRFDTDAPLGRDTVEEGSGAGVDTLDFSESELASVTVDLSQATEQTVNASLRLMLAAADVVERLVGGEQADVLTGNGLDNTIRGGPGHDELTGGLGNDTLEGGSGLDTVVEARDSNFVLQDTTLQIGGGESDSLNSIEEARLTGGGSVNTLDATAFTAGSVWLEGGAGADFLLGGSRADFLAGGAGDDFLEGGRGGDTYRFDGDESLGTDSISESPLTIGGVDTLDFSATTEAAVIIDLSSTVVQDSAIVVSGSGTVVNLRVTLSSGSAFENVVGGAGADEITGNSADNDLRWGEGGDTIEGAGGDDALFGEGGSDRYLFDADLALGSDRLFDDVREDGIDTLDFSATASAVEVDLAVGIAQVVNANLTLTLTTCEGIENLVGGAGADELRGNESDNRLEGRGGNDILTGRRGGDTYGFDADAALGTDRVAELADREGGVDTLDFSNTSSLSVSVDLSSTVLQTVNANLNLRLTSGAAVENATGGSLGDMLFGNALSNALDGGSGGDVLRGVGADDSLTGGAGNDSLEGGAGHDHYSFGNGWGADIVVESAAGGTDTLDLSAVTAALTASLGGSLSISAGANSITHSGAAVENFVFGTGADTATVSPSSSTRFQLNGGDGADALNVDAGGLAFVSASGRISVTGRQPVVFEAFETVNVLNPPLVMKWLGRWGRSVPPRTLNFNSVK